MNAQFVIWKAVLCHVDLFEQGTEPPMGTGAPGRGRPPTPGKSGVVVGVDPRSPANRAEPGDGDGPPIVGACRAAALNGQQNGPMPSFSGCQMSPEEGGSEEDTTTSGFGLGC